MKRLNSYNLNFALIFTTSLAAAVTKITALDKTLNTHAELNADCLFINNTTKRKVMCYLLAVN